jgi:hypothetical protein
MVEIDEELRIALRTFLRYWVKPESVPEFGEEDFEQLFASFLNTGFAEAFRDFHAEHGRYPEYEELRQASGLKIMKLGIDI